MKKRLGVVYRALTVVLTVVSTAVLTVVSTAVLTVVLTAVLTAVKKTPLGNSLYLRLNFRCSGPSAL